MNNKTIIILAAAIGIGAYFYFNSKKTPVRRNGANTGGGGTNPGGPVSPGTGTDTGDDGTDGTVITDDTGTDTTTDGGTTVYPAPTPNTPTNQEIDTMIAACVSVGGTWTTGGCIYSDSPNPRGGTGQTTISEIDLDLNLHHQPIVNPKTGNTVNTNNGFDTASTNTPNYAIEFAGLKKNKIFA